MKKNRILNSLLSVLMLTCLLVGCADSNDTNTQADTPTNISTEEQEEVLVSETVTEEESDVTEECPEGYVYDYQVSMEAIPEDIAALGGTCQGTIHAFPSKIGMALTELKMEKDPVLKAEVEKRIPEIEAALEEEIGGKFVVDGVILMDDLSWVFFCTEVETGHQFDLYYANMQYYAQLNEIDGGTSKNVINVSYYYDELESNRVRENLLSNIEKVYEDCDVKVRSQTGARAVDIAISQYVGGDIDKSIEQKKLLVLWEILQEYDETIYYNVSLVYYPPEYKGVIQEKCTTKFRYDFGFLYDEEAMVHLAENRDIWCCFKYSGRKNVDDAENLNIMLEQYKQGEYDEESIWKYWIL